MKILIDTQAYDAQKFGGISLVIDRIISGLISSGKYDINIPYYGVNNVNNTILTNVNEPDIKEKNRALTIEALKAQDFDLFIPTHYDPYFLDYIGNKPFIFILHDMIPEKLYGYIKYANDFYDNEISTKKLLLEKATHVITVSEHSKQDIINIVGIPENKITVMHLAYDPIQNIDINEKSLLNSDYILYTGGRFGALDYKNFVPFIAQVSPFLRNHPEILLMFTGLKFNRMEGFLIKQFGIENQIRNGFVTNEQIQQFYRHALAFVFPSSDEGFGLPILEAMNNNCIAVLNDTSIFREVAGSDYINFYQTLQADSLSNLLEHIYNSKKYANSNEWKKQYTAQYADILSRYSWSKSVNKYMEVIDSLNLN